MTTLATDVEPLDQQACQLLLGHWFKDPAGIDGGSFTAAIFQALKYATADDEDLLEKVFPKYVHASRVWHNDIGGAARIKAIARYQHRNQCPECGWPLDEGYVASTHIEGDVDPIGHCIRTGCGFYYD